MNLRGSWLQLRLAAARIDPVLALALALLIVAALAMLMLLPASRELARDYEQAQRSARLPSAPMMVAEPQGENQLLRLRQSLGQESSLQQQLGQVFALASRHGLVLRQGEYRRSVRPAARVVAYQINLPVKGSHAAIWQFALDVLRALPHAALDDVVFRRETIGEPQVEARLRLTLYLDDSLARAP